MRVGFGYDMHRLVKGDGVILGGVKVPFTKKLDGHSDADVLIHSICDALLGAMGKQDIGTHFPDNDASFKDISSISLLEDVNNKILKHEGYQIKNIDTTIVIEKPKLSKYKNKIKDNLAKCLGISSDKIGVKATTNEGLSDIGKLKAVASYCVVLLEENS